MKKEKNGIIEIETNIPDEVMEKHPNRVLGEITAIEIAPEEIPERDLSDFEI